MDKITHEMRLAQWTSIIRECNSSGIPKKSWMATNNVDEKRFYYWQRRIRQEAIQELQPTRTSTATFVELPAPSTNYQQGTQPDAVLHIGNCALEIRNSMSPMLLQTIVKVMSHAQ
jgi:putative transposase